MRIKFKKLHQQQQDESDCGIICLKIILNYFKSNLSLELLREYSGTTKSGTTMLGLLQCAQKIGLEAKGFEATIDNLKENNKILFYIQFLMKTPNIILFVMVIIK